MASNLFNRYIWLVDTIYRSGKITLDDINQKWVRNSMSEGTPIPNRTFHNHRIAIEEMFDISIGCNLSTYEYYIDNAEDMERGGVRSWLLNTFAVNNLINECHKLKGRIQFEHIPSGQQYLTSIIEAMRDCVKVEIRYEPYWADAATFEIEPYFVKIFKQRWYVIGRSDKIRIYALDRITSLNVTTHAFKMPESFDPESYFQDCYGIIYRGDLKAEKVRLRFDASQSNYIRALPLHHSQQEIETTDEYAVFEYFIKPTFDFKQEILLHGDAVEVLQPEWFRLELKLVAENVWKMYQTKSHVKPL
ncbi:MAG: helix-turn-helix transcriptional regulator [Paludibacter sp.]